MDLENNKISTILAILVFIGFLGAAKPVLFNEGSAAAKYLAKSSQLTMIQEQSVEDYMENALFGDGASKLNVSKDQYTVEERSEQVESIFFYDKLVVIILFVLCLSLLIPKLRNSKFLFYGLMPICLWILFQAAAVSLNGGKKFSELAVLAHATRWGLPLVLFIFLFCKDKTKWLLPAIICSSMTFAVHGWEAWNLNPPFQDLLYNFAAIFGVSPGQGAVHLFLKTVGCMDLFLAVSVLFYRKPGLFLWMVIWGFVTALSRPITIGIEAWPEFTMRIANCGLPLVLFLAYRFQTQRVEQGDQINSNEKVDMVYE